MAAHPTVTWQSGYGIAAPLLELTATRTSDTIVVAFSARIPRALRGHRSSTLILEVDRG